MLDLFGGAGGVATGLDSLGVEHVSVEWWQPAADVARAAGHRVVVGDVRDPDTLDAAARELGGVDLLWASPPCQAWSTAGQRNGAADERNGWPWTIDALARLDWPPLIAENVPGMLHHSGQHCGDPNRCARCYVDGWLLLRLREHYVHVEVRTLDAADLGVPQHRRRVIIQARHDGIRWPALTHGDPASMFVAAGVRKRWRTVRDVLGYGGTGALWLRTEMTGATGRPDTQPAPAVGGAGVLYAHDEDPGRRLAAPAAAGRRLTVDECAVLQGFPAGYPWHAAGSKSAAYQAVGNAVPPAMSAALVGAYL